MASKRMPDEKQQPSFEQGLAKLEGIVEQLESGDLSLEESLQLFEKGMKLSHACREQLEAAETKVEILTKKGKERKAEPLELDDAPF